MKNKQDLNINGVRAVRNYATIEQIVILSMLEHINSLFIPQDLPLLDRLLQLNQVAITQKKSLLTFNAKKKLSQFKTSNLNDNMLNLPPFKNS